MEDLSWKISHLVEDCLWRTSPVTWKTLLGTVLWSASTGEGFDFLADCSENLGGEQVSRPGWFLGSPGRQAGVLARLVPGVLWEAGR